MRAYVGLGSNVGDRLGHLRLAVDSLRGHAEIKVVATSSVYETVAVGPPQPDFLNAVGEIDTTLSARDLVREFKSIEAEIGRVARERWGPREVDLDLLLYGDRLIDEPGLTVPHPELTNRAFVLVPLVEIAPEIEVPRAGKASALLARVDRAGVRSTSTALT